MQNAYYRNNKELYNANEDGIAHINAYSQGRTKLGRFLSNFSYSPFEHESYGKFNSVEAFWYWLSTGKKYDIIKLKHGFKAKEVGRAFKKVAIEESEFREEIHRAIELKMYSNKIMLNELIKCKLPILHYYARSKEDSNELAIKHSPEYDWILDIYDIIRERHKKNYTAFNNNDIEID